jgi:translation initiation factor 2B subunit (eIF-2B alpha/beta/delta family)
MSEDRPSEENLSEEFRKLGQNLVSAIQTAWDLPERKRFQDEVVSGLNEFGETLRKEAEQFANSSTGQRIKDNVENIGDKIRSSDTQVKVRQDLINALKLANNEIQKVVNRWLESESKTDPGETKSEGDDPKQAL